MPISAIAGVILQHVCRSMYEKAREQNRKCGLVKSGYVCVRVCVLLSPADRGKRLMLSCSLCGRLEHKE